MPMQDWKRACMYACMCLCMYVRMFGYRYVRTLDLGPITTFKCGLKIRAPHVYSTTGGDGHGDF